MTNSKSKSVGAVSQKNSPEQTPVKELSTSTKTALHGKKGDKSSEKSQTATKSNESSKTIKKENQPLSKKQAAKISEQTQIN